MVFVPEGQHDSSQARSDWNHLENSPVPAGRLNESPRNQTVHQRAFHHPASIPQSLNPSIPQSLNPPSVTSVTSVRCSPPMRAFLAQKPNSPPKSLPPPSLNPPSVTSVTSVRCSFPGDYDLAAVSYSIIAFSARNRKELTATAKMIRRPTITS
jgi:hypothetical protein